jgi:8-oxo-dGTP pyrophosphatase MutT (NUDIX family)
MTKKRLPSWELSTCSFLGGGIELGENIEQAAKREAEEEVGCKIKNINIIGEILELKSKIKRRQITTFVTAELDGEKGLPTTKQEDEQGIKIYWLSREEAIKVLEEQETSIPLESYNSKFNARTNNIFIKKI